MDGLTPEESLAVAIDIGWRHPRIINGVVYGLYPQMFTIGLMCDCGKYSYERRYCYPNYTEAAAALSEWDGEGHPPGPWVKLKGRYRGLSVDCRPEDAP